MSRRRRGALLAGLSLLLGGLAASDVAGREAALRRGVGPLVDVVVAREPLEAGARRGPEAPAGREGAGRLPPRRAAASAAAAARRPRRAPAGAGPRPPA